jgi:hypothetical protein
MYQLPCPGLSQPRARRSPPPAVLVPAAAPREHRTRIPPAQPGTSFPQATTDATSSSTGQRRMTPTNELKPHRYGSRTDRLTTAGDRPPPGATTACEHPQRSNQGEKATDRRLRAYGHGKTRHNLEAQNTLSGVGIRSISRVFVSLSITACKPEQDVHCAMPQQVHVIDRVRARGRHCGQLPHSPGRMCSAIRPLSPGRVARAITGTSLACDTRFGLSNDACVFARLCNNCT